MQTVLHSIYAFLLPQEHAQNASLIRFALNSLQNIAHSLVWFLLVGLLVYGFSLSRRNRASAQRFSYSQPIDEPGNNFSLRGALRYLLPASFYRHPSFRQPHPLLRRHKNLPRPPRLSNPSHFRPHRKLPLPRPSQLLPPYPQRLFRLPQYHTRPQCPRPLTSRQPHPPPRVFPRRLRFRLFAPPRPGPR